MVLGIKLGLPDLAADTFAHLAILPTYKSYFNIYSNGVFWKQCIIQIETDFDAGGLHSLLYIVHFEEKNVTQCFLKEEVHHEIHHIFIRHTIYYL